MKYQIFNDPVKYEAKPKISTFNESYEKKGGDIQVNQKLYQIAFIIQITHSRTSIAFQLFEVNDNIPRIVFLFDLKMANLFF